MIDLDEKKQLKMGFAQTQHVGQMIPRNAEMVQMNGREVLSPLIDCRMGCWIVLR
jgi:hypothetical protein